MSRTQLALTSLVAAIPAGFLSYLLVMVFLSRADSLKTMTQIVVGVTLLCSAFITLMPVGLLVMGGKKAKADDKKSKDADSEEVSEEAAEVADEEEGSGEVSEAEELDEDEDDADAEETFDMEESDAEIMSDSSGEFDTGPASSFDEIESVDFDDEEDEPKPKKKKK